MTTALLSLLLLLLSGVSAWGQHVTLRNNLIYDATLTPNLGFDVQTSDHWSVGANVGFHPWPSDDNAEKKLRHLLIAPELRRWNIAQQQLRLPTTDSLYRSRTGYWGLNLIYSHYNVSGITFPFGLYKSVRDHRKQGDLAAIGAFYGYTWRLSRLFRLEAEVGVGIGYSWSKEYDCMHCGTYYGRDNKPFLVPKLALNIVLDKQRKAIEEPTPPTPSTPPTPPAPPVLVFHSVTPATVSDRLLADNPVLCEYKDYQPYDRTRILRKEKGALYVHFPLNKADISLDFRDNAATLDRIVDITRQIMADTASNVRLIQIIGLASIEGAVNSNEVLAANRAEALKLYIQQHVDTPDSMYELCNGGEAWAELRDQLCDALTIDNGQAISREAIQEAIDLIDSEPNLTRREQRLRRLNGGATFRYISNELLPQQRNSGYLRIYFDRVPDERAATINRASELLTQKRYHEALKLLLTVADDERAQNALGVAFFYNGEMGNAIECFERAAEKGNADARENLRQMYRQLER